MPGLNPGPLPQKSGALAMSHHISTKLCIESEQACLLANVDARPAASGDATRNLDEIRASGRQDNMLMCIAS